MTARMFNVLFLLQGNTARSVLAEGILRKEGAGRFNAFSPEANQRARSIRSRSRCSKPTAIRNGFRSKSWDEFAAPGAPTMDFIFTVCDSAAGEACPVWLGHPATAHWGIPDPPPSRGSDIEKEAAFNTAFRLMKNRISLFTALPLASLDQVALANRLREIGRSEGASPGAAG